MSNGSGKHDMIFYYCEKCRVVRFGILGPSDKPPQKCRALVRNDERSDAFHVLFVSECGGTLHEILWLHPQP